MVTSGDLSIRRSAALVQPAHPVAPVSVVDTLDNNNFVIIRAGGNKAMKHSCSGIHDQSLRSPARIFRDTLQTERERNGFLLDYVIHGEGGVQGSHCIEVVLRAADLTWPYLQDLSLVWQIVEVYSHFVFIDFVCPFVVDAACRPWFFVNVVLTEGLLLATSPQAGCLSSSAGCPVSWVPSILCQWDRLRIGYDWAGKRESVLIVNAEALCVKLLKDVQPELIHSSWHLRPKMWAESSIILPVDIFVRWEVSTHGDKHPPDSLPRDIPTVAGRSHSGYGGEDLDAAETTSNSSLHITCGKLQLQLATSISQHLKSFADVLQQALCPPTDTALDTMKTSVKEEDSDSDASISFPPASHQLNSQTLLASVPSESSMTKSVGSKHTASVANTAYRTDYSGRPDRRDEPQMCTWLKTPKVHEDLCGPPRADGKTFSQPGKASSRRQSANSMMSRWDPLSKYQVAKNLLCTSHAHSHVTITVQTSFTSMQAI